MTRITAPTPEMIAAQPGRFVVWVRGKGECAIHDSRVGCAFPVTKKAALACAAHLPISEARDGGNVYHAQRDRLT